MCTQDFLLFRCVLKYSRGYTVPFCYCKVILHFVQAPVSPVASPSAQSIFAGGSFYGVSQLSPSAPAYAGPYPSLPSSANVSSNIQNESIFPERPGQPECLYYMRTGHCKYGSSCRYHHPPEWMTSNISSGYSHMGLPLRPVSFHPNSFCTIKG